MVKFTQNFTNLGGSFTARINHIRNTMDFRGWSDADTHIAFAMRFNINLVVVQATNGEIYPVEFSATGSNHPLDPNLPTTLGAYVNLNHYMAILPSKSN